VSRSSFTGFTAVHHKADALNLLANLVHRIVNPRGRYPVNLQMLQRPPRGQSEAAL
jgi:hypothetical protein